MKLDNLFDIQDELNLFLTAQRLKPASYLNPILKNNHRVERSIATLIKNSANLKELEDILTTCNLEYQLEVIKHPNSNYYINYLIATNKQYLEQLITAETDTERGLALGYPKEDVQSFFCVVNGEKRIWSSVLVAFAKARKSSIEIPSWLAYLSFVPKTLDLVNNKVSQSAKKIGKLYQHFVRANNPELGERVEESFKSIKLPISWLKLPDKSYHLEF